MSHLMFVDDLIGKDSEVAAMLKCLETYCGWSCQATDPAESSVFVLRCVDGRIVNQKCHTLGCKKLGLNTNYLGAPLFLSIKKAQDFDFLRRRVEDRLNGWSCKYLSCAGKGTLIKSMAQSIPSYTMATFKVPNGVCEMDSAVRQFWWTKKKKFFVLIAITMCPSKIVNSINLKELGRPFKSYFSPPS